jgi:acetyl esterase/lipase
MAAYGAGYAGTPALEPSCDVTPVAPAGVIAVHPVADLAGTWADLKALFPDEPFPETYTGGTPSDVPDRYEAASVGRLVRAGLPPTLLYTGVNDALVHVERIRTLAASLRAAGAPVDLVEVPFADHGFDSPPNGFGAQLEEALLRDFIDRVAPAP